MKHCVIDVHVICADPDISIASELGTFLVPLHREGLLRSTFGWNLPPGVIRSVFAAERLNTAELIVLLVTPSLLAHEEIWEGEVLEALRLHRSRRARLLPVHLRPVNWKRTPFGEIASLPRNGAAFGHMSNRDQYWLEVAQAIRSTAEDILSLRSGGGSEFESSLKLLVRGTPIMYIAPLRLSVVRIGRQRKKAEQGADEGNDLVVRVSQDAGKSQLISRRHLEIHRRGGQIKAVDISRHGTFRAGKRLPFGQPVLLSNGDQLTLAQDVLTIEVLVDQVLPSGMRSVDRALVRDDVSLEASFGDLLTAEP